MSKFFLVTGATKGIGLAISKRLLLHGYEVVGVARHNSNPPFPGIFYPIDLSDAAATKAGFEQIDNDYCLSGIINNVGIVLPQSFNEIQLTDFNAVLDLN